MGVSADAAAGSASGLATVVDTIAAPAVAFERQRTAPTWGWAAILATILVLIGVYLQGPAARHAGAQQTRHMLSANTSMASMSDAQKQQMVERASRPSPFAYIGALIGVFLAVLLNALILLAGNAAGRGQANFKQLWCGSMNIAVPTLGLGAIVLGIITTVRGADSFSNTLQVAASVPSVASIVPASSPPVLAFLASVSVFTIWGFILNSMMLRITGKTSASIAYTFAAIVLVLGALFAAGGAAFGQKFGMF